MKNEAKMLEEHIKIVKKVTSYVDLDSPEYAEWIFDTLYVHYWIDANKICLDEIKTLLSDIATKKKLIDKQKQQIAS